MQRKKLSDILNGQGDDLKKAWKETQSAADFAPLPPGEYEATIIEGQLDQARTGTPEYRLTFKVTGGPHAGRFFWHHLYLTPAALAMAKRDLGKLGVTSLDQLEGPLPARFRCKVKLALRRDDNGNESNKVRSFEVVGIDRPEPDPFAPPAANGNEKGATIP